jgi:hypothetical protein
MIWVNQKCYDTNQMLKYKLFFSFFFDKLFSLVNFFWGIFRNLLYINKEVLYFEVFVSKKSIIVKIRVDSHINLE